MKPLLMSFLLVVVSALALISIAPKAGAAACSPPPNICQPYEQTVCVATDASGCCTSWACFDPNTL